jgi:hypothetical protein
MKSKMGIRGHVYAVLKNRDGDVIQVHECHNTITNLMDAHVADCLSDRGDAVVGYMAVGTGSGQTASSTGLAVSLDRNALTSTTQGAGADDNDVVYVGDWAAGDGTGTITEAGILRANDNLTLMAYDDSMNIVKGASDTLQITWTITFGAS